MHVVLKSSRSYEWLLTNHIALRYAEDRAVGGRTTARLAEIDLRAQVIMFSSLQLFTLGHS